MITKNKTKKEKFLKEQKKLATEMKDQLNSIVKEKFKKEIVTWIEPVSNFYRAEEYHQRYLTKFS